MKNDHSISFKKFWAQFFFLVLPTITVAVFLLWNANHYFSILREQWITQSIYFTLGLICGLWFYLYRFRMFTTFAVLLIVFALIYKGLDNYIFGEFDSFFISKQFLVFAILFSFGWFCGWGLQRKRSFALFLSALFFVSGIYLISKTGQITLPSLFLTLIPLVLYSLYLIYAHSEIQNAEETKKISFRKLALRLVLFLGLLFITGAGVVYLMYDTIQERVEQYGGGKSQDQNSLLKKNKDGSVKNQDQLQVSNQNQRNKELVFCAYIDHFFESGFPNPLYMTSGYYTLFDTLTETFEPDPKMISNDLFSPDPSRIPLFFVEKDSSKIKNTLSDKYRKSIQIEVYKKRLSKDAFLAPATAFKVQPITVEKDYQSEFKYAYRATSYISELNSAYFIYNSDNFMIRSFQEERFNELRKAKPYDLMPENFMKYYTHFPSASKFDDFRYLGDSLAHGKTATIDKILAIRDYFLQKDPLGESLYTYSDNPGIVGLPGASKLQNFMFETRKGYCAYYAGSTLLLLRAMGIPSRIAVGFMTVDRSDNNKGWYWYYADQAHAWVQVYFPEYGWLDFDTTVGNDEARQSPQPDGTPPLKPPKPVLVLSGSSRKVDTLRNKIQLLTKNLLFRDKEFENVNKTVELDLNHATLWKDSAKISISEIKENDDITAVSYDEKKADHAYPSAEEVLAGIKKPIEVDEVYIKTLAAKKENSKKDNASDKPVTLKQILGKIFLFILGVIMFLFMLPWLTYLYFKMGIQTQSPGAKCYHIFRSAQFYLNQLGHSRGNKTALKFAEEDIDPEFGGRYADFIKLYLKIKYGKQGLNSEEYSFVKNFYPPWEKKIKGQIPFGNRLKHFLNLNQYIYYFLKNKSI